MNYKKFEKFVNKKITPNNNNSNNINKSNLNINFYGNYKFSQTTNIYSNNYITKNIKPKKNSKYNSYKSNLFPNFMQNKQKFKFIPGMFSYKNNTYNNRSLNNSYESKNTRNNSSQISNKLNINNQNHLLPNLKLLIDNTETSSLRTLTNNDNISNHFPSISSLNLNKYKIDMVNNFNNTNYNYDVSKYNNNNIIINNIQQPKIRSKSNEIMHFNSNKQKYNYNNNNLNNNLNNIIKIKNNFEGKTNGENESRRMIVEFLKVLKHNENNREINNILKLNNISNKVLNQQKDFSKLINYTNRSLNNSYASLYYKKIEMPKKKQISKILINF